VTSLTGPPVFTSGALSSPRTRAAAATAAANPSRQSAAAALASPNDFVDQTGKTLGIVCPDATGAYVSTAPGEATRAPSPAKYDYRTKDLNTGQITISHTSVENVFNLPQQAFTFDVVSEQSGASTRTSYRVVPFQRVLPVITNGNIPADQKALAAQQAGIFITAIETRSASGASQRLSFTPVASGQGAVPISDFGLKVMKFPANVNPPPSWHSEAMDQATQTKFSVDGAISGQEGVNACGSKIEAWRVNIANGTISSPGKQTTFTASYWFGTQYGGLSLQNIEENSLGQRNESIIDTVPAPPQ